MNLYLIIFIFSMILTMVLVPIFCGAALRLGISLDVPNERKMHQQPTPRVGGIAMALGIVVPLIFWVELGSFVKIVLLGSGVIVIFGLIDDIRELRFRVKFAGQFLAAFLVIFFGGLQLTDLGTIIPGTSNLPSYLAIPLTAIVIVGVTNAINLADGLDGLAGGISMLSFIVIAYFAYSLEVGDVALMSLAVAGAIFGFLRFNTYPSVIFMGDTGSQLLGFLAVTSVLKLTQSHGPVSPYVPLLIMGFPILDTLVVMSERIVSGRSPFVADKNHLHHKLIKLGFVHSEAVIIIYSLQTLYVTAAYLFRFYSDMFVLSTYLVLSALVAITLVSAQKHGYNIKEYHLFDKLVRGQLRVLKENNVLIKISFQFILVSVPLLLFSSCLVPRYCPPFLGKLSFGLVLVLLAIALTKTEWLSNFIRVALFIVIPFIAYFSETGPGDWVPGSLLIAYNIWGLFAILFIILTMKLTRRIDGLKATPLHFLILSVALIIPNLPGAHKEIYLGMVAAKIIFFFFGFEVLIGELRDKMNWLCFTTLLSLSVLTAKVSFGF